MGRRILDEEGGREGHLDLMQMWAHKEMERERETGHSKQEANKKNQNQKQKINNTENSNQRG